MYGPSVDFDEQLGELAFRGMQFSEDSKAAINHYLFNGWKPGGHLEAMFAHDYERALYNADVHNRTVFWATAMWIRENAPQECQGSYRAVEDWCTNHMAPAREAFREKCEKESIWKTLRKS
jgi:hypothetical protein